MPITATVTVDTHRGSVPWDRMLLGQFIEHFHRQIYGGIFDPGSRLSDARGFRRDVIAALRELRVPVVRWPGGCFVSSYHWLDGVGARRQPAFDKAWRVEDPNTFGTDEFIAWCRDIGAEPYLCTNGGSGSAEEMSDWVEYCNLTMGKWGRLRAANGSPQPHAVGYWSIGNENYGSWEMGAKTAGEWGRFVLESAKMMRRVDPGIRLLAAARNDLAWMSELLGQAGNLLDYVSLHAYYDPLWETGSVPAGFAACMQRTLIPEREITLAEHVLGALGQERIAIAFDEWNLRSWHHPHSAGFAPVGNAPATIAERDRNDDPATYTMADALFSACFLNTCLRHAKRVHMANMAPVVNTRGPLFVHPDGIVRRTTYHVLRMYAHLLGGRVADAWVESEASVAGEHAVPAVDALATCGEDGRGWRIVLVNRDAANPVRCRIRIGGASVAGRLAATMLDGDHPDAFNSIVAPDRVRPREITLPAVDGAVEIPQHALVVLAC